MIAATQDIADAVVDLVATSTEEQIPAIIDAALAMLDVQGRRRDIRLFGRSIDRALRRRGTTLPAVVTSAVLLDSLTREHLRSGLEQRMTRKIDLGEDHDASLLGGAIVECNDLRFDASLKTILRSFLLHP